MTCSLRNRRSRSFWAGCGAVCLFSAIAPSLLARVDHFTIVSRQPVAGGKAFGRAGPFELIRGMVFFSVDPGSSANRVIVDLDKAPRDNRGRVPFSADFCLIRPVNLTEGNGSLLLEIPNRGGMGLLALMNGANSALAGDVGDGWVLAQGYTVGWVGWQWDAAGKGALRLHAPVAKNPDGSSIRGRLRDDFCLVVPCTQLPLGHWMGGRLGGSEYPLGDSPALPAVLTVRDDPLSPRQQIDRAAWSVNGDQLHFESGFRPGKIYELIYPVQDPVVAGLGFAAVRDFVSYLKRQPNDLASARRAYAMGISQTGRFLRDFVYQGFNADESDALALDGIMAHVAGAGRGSFNQRFAQPSRDAQPSSAFFYPTDLFPFTDSDETDPLTGETAGLLDLARRAHAVPKMFFSETSYEYWSRSASLIHTSPDGSADAPIADSSRIYFFAGLQHYSAVFPPARGKGETGGQNPMNSNPVRWIWRGLLTSLDAWVKEGVPPPPSRYPRVSDQTLVAVDAVNFPAIPKVRRPADASVAWRMDYGPEWKRGIVDRQPPGVGASFPTKVPQVDADGNDRGGINLPELAAPVATYTGWNLRDPAIGAPGRRVAFLGSYLPFARTRSERERTGDPRPSLAERYRDEADYLDQYRKAAQALVRERWLRAEDLPAIIERGRAEWRVAQAGP